MSGINGLPGFFYEVRKCPDILKHIQNLGICQEGSPNFLSGASSSVPRHAASAEREIWGKADAGKNQILNVFEYRHLTFEESALFGFNKETSTPSQLQDWHIQTIEFALKYRGSHSAHYAYLQIIEAEDLLADRPHTRARLYECVLVDLIEFAYPENNLKENANQLYQNAIANGVWTNYPVIAESAKHLMQMLSQKQSV